MQMRNAFERIAERQQTAREVGTSVAFQFEDDRRDPAFDPDFSTDNSPFAIVDLTSDDTVMNSKSHSSIFAEHGVEGKWLDEARQSQVSMVR